jgi:hypothetical protein
VLAPLEKEGVCVSVTMRAVEPTALGRGRLESVTLLVRGLLARRKKAMVWARVDAY